VLADAADVADRAVVWNAHTGAVIATHAPGSEIGDVAIAPGGAVAYVSGSTTVRALQLPSLAELWRSDELAGELALSADGATLVVIGTGGRIVGLASDTGALVGRAGINAMMDAVVVPSTGELFTVGAGSGVTRWSLAAPTAQQVIREPAHDQTPGAIAVSADGRALATSSYGTVELVDPGGPTRSATVKASRSAASAWSASTGTTPAPSRRTSP
jgi:hypothetical protein